MEIATSNVKENERRNGDEGVGEENVSAHLDGPLEEVLDDVGSCFVDRPFGRVRDDPHTSFPSLHRFLCSHLVPLVVAVVAVAGTGTVSSPFS